MNNHLNLVILLLLFVFISCNGDKNEENKKNENNNSNFSDNLTCKKNYGMSFPPFKNSEEINFTLKELKALNINKIRIAIDWKYREPNKGEYNWKAMDERMNSAGENNVSVLLTVHSSGPDWACSNVKNDKSCVFNDEEDFKRYVKDMINRYEIDKIQFGNEWENTYAGTMEEFVKFNNILYETVKDSR